jgi:hypothetical protein
MSFKKKSNGVGLQFHQKMPVCGKTDGNSIFLGRETHIPDRLYIMVIYISFDEFGSKSKGDSFTKNICSR